MNAIEVNCPKCGYQFDVSAAMSGQVEEKLRKEIEEAARKRTDKVVAAALEKQSLKMADLQNQLQEKQGKLEELKSAQLKVLDLERKLGEQEETAQEEIQRRVAEQVKTASEESARKALAKAQESFANREKVLVDEVAQREDQYRVLQQKELNLLREKRELEDKARSADLELERRLDEERKKIQEKVSGELQDAQQRKLAEKEKQISDLNKALDEMKRKAEQGSMQVQGEVLEEELEKFLQREYPLDTVEPISKGVRGGDIVLMVRDPGSYSECGSVLIETKNAKAWSNGWIEKVKEDRVQSGVDIAVIVSVVLPKDVEGCALVDDVWVCQPGVFGTLINMLRIQLHEIYRTIRAHEGGETTRDQLFRYVTGTEFRQRMQSIIEVFAAQRAQIDKERRAMEKHWRTREKQAERVILNLSAISGDMTGLLGAEMPEMQLLELGDSDENTK